MAKQLYDYWFVQFDFPNENGKPYKSGGGKMVWNEKLKKEKFQKGWNVLKLGEHCSFNKKERVTVISITQSFIWIRQISPIIQLMNYNF